MNNSSNGKLYELSPQSSCVTPYLEKDNDEYYASLKSIIAEERITTVFQPIFHLHTAEVYAYEALSRTVGPSLFDGPASLFRYAQQFELTPNLERLCLNKALAHAEQIGIDKYLSINICPSVLKAIYKDSALKRSLISDFYEIKDKIIFELTERFYVQDNDFFKKIIQHYKSQGFRIAVDDLGSGFTGLQMLAELEPHMVKIDRSLISGIERSTKKRLLLESIVSFCHKINAMVVAEGIETKEELEVVCTLMVDLAQGYLLARPQQEIQGCSTQVRDYLLDLNMVPRAAHQDSNFIGALCEYVEPVAYDQKLETILSRLQNDKGSLSIPVLCDRVPVGIIHKDKTFFKLGQQFGYSLYIKKAVKYLMDRILVFESNTPLEEVSREVLSREESSIYDAVVVVKNGAYTGLVKIHHILSRITEQKVMLAMQTNPLTGLAGNNRIREEISDRLKANEVFAVMYFDLDTFKPFNDRFGFEQGDRILRFLGSLLKESVIKWDPKGFLGHIGGDDFVAVCSSSGVEALCATIIERFDHEVKGFHDQETVERGFYESIDRQGVARSFPILSLSIAVTTTRDRSFNSYGHLVSVASEIKKKAKAIAGSSYCIDRRQQ